MNHIAPDQMLAAIASIPSLPAVVTELLADLQDDGVDLHTLANKIALDSALTARLLQLANSSFYGLPRQVASVAEPYQATFAHPRQHGVPMVQAEQFELGLDHATVGAALATHWKFPDSIRLAIAEHHDSDRPGLDPVVMLVQLANEMSLALKHARSDQDRLRAVPCAAWQRLHLTEGDLFAAFTQADEALTLVADILFWHCPTTS